MFENTFNNSQVYTQALPTITALNKQLLSPKYAKANLIVNITSTVLLSAIVYAVLHQPFVPLAETLTQILSWVVWGIIALGMYSTVYFWLADPRKTYALRDHDLSYSSGLIFKKTVTQPLSRIQHIELKRGPIESKIGLATLQVFSAGGALETFEVPGLPVDEAQKLREFILQYKGILQHG